MAKRTDNKGRILKPGESQRKDGTYMFRYTDQIKRRKSIYANTLQELRTKAQKAMAQEILYGVDYSQRLTLAELVLKYNASRVAHRCSTQKAYASRYNALERDPFAAQQASKIRPPQAKAWLISLYENGRTTSGVYVLGGYIKSVYKWGIENELVTKNPFDIKMDFLPEQTETRSAISKEELARYLEFVRTHPIFNDFYDYLIVLAETGMRLSEFLGLTISDIDFVSKRISVVRQLRSAKNSTTFYIEKPKTKSGARVIPMSDVAMLSLARMIRRAQQASLQQMVDGVSGFVVIRPDGELYSAGNFDTRIKHIRKHYQAKYADAPNITPHVLRHTFCTELIHSDVPIPIVQGIMGHANPTVTLRVYTHVISETAADKLVDAFQEQGAMPSVYQSRPYTKNTPKARENA